jgi:hypothetical protein
VKASALLLQMLGLQMLGVAEVLTSNRKTISRFAPPLGADAPGVNRRFFYFCLRIRVVSLFSERFHKGFLHLTGEAST